MGFWENILKDAKSCHSKHSWEEFFLKYSQAISNSNTSRPISEIFKLLLEDPQSLKYDPIIFGTLIRGCLSSWDLALGDTICHFGKNITAPSFSIPAVLLYLENGQPLQARTFAYRSLRLLHLEIKDFHQLQTLVCSSFAEEGKHNKATKMIRDIVDSIQTTALPPKHLADILIQIARIEFLLGRYSQAGSLFKEASQTYLTLNEWESAAKALFNTAACSQNAGVDPIEVAFAFVEESRRISEKHELKGPLSHCEAFYGLDAYQKGNFAEATEHFKRALACLPIADKSYRRLHILSMLTLTYLISGQYYLAHKIGAQTLELAALDLSKRYRSRYLSLEAELTWEEGKLTVSQEILSKAMSQLEIKGITTLEELSSYSRYILQSAQLQEQVPHKIKINPLLKKQKFTYFDHKYAQGQAYLTENNLKKSHQEFSEIMMESQDCGDRYHYALAIQGIIQTRLISKQIDQKTENLIGEFEIAVRRISETPIKAQLPIILASLAYHKGEFKECARQLKIALKNTRLSFTDTFAVSCWNSTVEGRSFRLIHPWQVKLIARQTKLYFSPEIQILDQHNFIISKHYQVSLEKHPSLSELLQYLTQQPFFRSKISNIQTEVWKESLKNKGWKQKIRNAIMRIRDFFPYTLAPLILHNEEVILYTEAIYIHTTRHQAVNRQNEILRLLVDHRMTSQQLSARLQLSPATIKRELKFMLDSQQVGSDRIGRNIFYFIE